MNLECQQVETRGGLPLRGITGGIRFIGQFDGEKAYTTGELALDSIISNNLQLTNVRAPIWIDGSECLMGEPATRRQGQPSRRLTADAYGGSITANAELRHHGASSYKADIKIGAVSLSRFASERLGGPKDISGSVSGTLAIEGTAYSKQTLRGYGELHVVDAHIYELPPLVGMLKMLSNRPPNTTAFNRCDMKFAIQGEHINFTHLNLLGDAFSLYGQGDVDLKRNLDLQFYTMLAPVDLPIPFWKTLAGQVSQQGLQLNVVGTFDDPKVERKPFPAINDMLDQLQNGLEEGAANMTPSTAILGPSAKPR